ncbi:MAG TPA: acetylglutamate kinase [Candidatus Pelagibacter sp.]|jgi:acetylglutamate kinase|nr:acetylglutamate kinase [Candidatus Pelagibacter sp.]
MLAGENLNNKIKKLWPKDGPPVHEVEKYIQKYLKERIVIKCGGRVLLDPNLFGIFIEDITILKKLGLTPLVVHGGGPRIKKRLDDLNIKSKFIMGLRVTDERVIKVVEEVMNEFNKEIVNALEKKLCSAQSITIKENIAIYVQQKNIELGYVGFPTKIDIKVIEDLINNNFIPVVTPMGLDAKNKPHNINADTAAGALATSLKSRRLLLMTDVEGVYDKNKKIIQEIKPLDAEKLIHDGTIKEGMIPKIRTCINATNNGVKGVVIIDGRKPHSILFELFSDKGAGTLIRK